MLKQQTADSHRDVEQRLGLLDALTPARMLTTLGLLHGFWAAVEPAVDDWFAAHPGTAAELQWARRARLDRLHDDLLVLADACGVDAPTLAVAPPVFGDMNEAVVLGWLYVAEGSTLGGAVIHRSLRAADFPVLLGSFTPYPEGPGPMWRAYLTYLGRWTAGGAPRTELVVGAGVRAFAALESWVSARVPEAAA